MSDEILGLAPPPADQRIRYGRDPQHFADLRFPSDRSPAPVAMNIHGGFWRAGYDLAHAGHLCAVLAAKGIATFNIEYRRVGDAGGGWPGTFDDIKSAFRCLRKHAAELNLDAGRILVMGHSAGGQLALCLAAHEPAITGVISLAGVLDLKRACELHLSNGAVVGYMGGRPEQVPDRYLEASPIELPVSASQVLIHGTADDSVPVEFSRNYVARKQERGEQVEYKEIAGADHFDPIDPRSGPWKIVEESVLKLLGSFSR